MTKTSVHCAPYLRNHNIIWLSFMVYMCKMIIFAGIFSVFSNFDFLSCEEGKRAKKPKMTKKYCPWHSIFRSHTSKLSFLVHMSKIIMSSGIFLFVCLFVCFLIFSKFWFSRLLEGWKGKKWSKMTKNSVHYTQYLRNHTSYDCHLWYTCVKW